MVRLFFILFNLFFWAGYLKNNVDENKSCVPAIIYNGRDTATDGCGWMVIIDETYYMTKSVPGEFQIDSMAVCIQYENIDSLHCGFRGKKPTIRILEIE